MIEIIHYPLFIITVVTLNLYPGPDTLYILTRSTAQGRAAGVASALGISSGCVIHALLGALGLAAVVMASATAYQNDQMGRGGLSRLSWPDHAAGVRP